MQQHLRVPENWEESYQRTINLRTSSVDANQRLLWMNAIDKHQRETEKQDKDHKPKLRKLMMVCMRATILGEYPHEALEPFALAMRRSSDASEERDSTSLLQKGNPAVS